MFYTKEISGTVYSFSFGLGFARKIDAQEQTKDANGRMQKMGITYALAGLVDKDPDQFINIMLIGNSFAESPRLTRETIEEWMDSDGFDFFAECEELLDFLRTSNFTRAKAAALDAYAERQKELDAAAHAAAIKNAGEA